MNILVIGDIILDINMHGHTHRLAPEAPIPVINIDSIEYKLGGAGNVASNLKSLNCNVTICSVIGNDNNGNIIKGLLQKHDIIPLLFFDNRNTTSKYRTYIGSSLHARYDIENNHNIDQTLEQQIIHVLTDNIHTYNAIIFSDYMKGMLTENICKNMIDLANTHDIFTAVDPKDKKYNKYIGCTFIKPNKIEAINIIGSNTTVDNAEETAIKIKNLLNCKICMITYGDKGLCILDHINNFNFLYIVAKKEIIDVIGAGDTVLSAFIYKYLHTKNTLASAHFANYCGQIKVTHIGAYSITGSDELQYIRDNDKLLTKNKLPLLINNKMNNKIVFTNGCFDILHAGHITYLREAKNMGTILIVGLNSDNSIKNIKGPNRPINNINNRILQLQSLYFVDYIIVFDQNTPLELLQELKPDIYVKGGDYNLTQLEKYKPFCTEIKVLSYVQNISSTIIMDKITS